MDEAFRLCNVSSFADLGGCWGVNGGYAFYALSHYPISKAYIVDGNITELTRRRARNFPQLELLQGMLGSDSTIREVGAVDALVMFDILLHQVAPDWDQFLEKWCIGKECVVVYNQNWTASDHSIRFVEQGLDWYKKNAHYSDGERLERWFAKHPRYCKEQGKPFRDIHNFWQWGIVRSELLAVMARLGFEAVHTQHDGAFLQEKPWLVNEGFVFRRT